MSVTIDMPATSAQLSGKTPDGLAVLAVIAKRTYRIRPDGRCELAGEQEPLIMEPVFDPDDDGLLVSDTDLWSLKPLTDVVVKGHVHGRGARRLEAAVRVGSHLKRLAVLGDRVCRLSATGEIVFSEPAPIERIPLRYTHAYGGRDTTAEARYGNPYLALREGLSTDECDLDLASPFVYPRNPCGCGFLVEATPEAVETTRLPNLEDPTDLLTPERLVLGDPLRWMDMPIPQSTDWVDHGWFPRVAYLGVVPPFESVARSAPEVTRGWALEGIESERVPDGTFALRMTCGASLGLQLPHLSCGESIELRGMHPTHEVFRLRLPRERPALWVDGREGRLRRTRPVIQTVVVDVDSFRLQVVWRGSALARRPYLPEELQTMPFRVKW